MTKSRVPYSIASSAAIRAYGRDSERDLDIFNWLDFDRSGLCLLLKFVDRRSD
jgi:hypothetical protein